MNKFNTMCQKAYAKFQSKVVAFKNDESGAAATEYLGIIIVAVVIIGVVITVAGDFFEEFFRDILNKAKETFMGYFDA